MVLGDLDKKQKRKKAKDGKLAYQLLKYVYCLQAGAKEKKLKRDLEVLKTRLKIIESGYRKWLDKNPDFGDLKNPEAKYNSEMGKRKVNLQIQALEYLLN